MFCSNCGQNLAGVVTQYCPNCGHAEEILKTMNPQPPVGAPLQGQGNAYPPQHQQVQQAPHGYPQQGQPPYGHAPYGQPPHGYPGYPPYGFYGKPPAQGMAGAALGLGIAALLLPVPFLDLIFGIIALVLAITARKKGNRSGLSTGALVMAIIGTIAAFFYTVMWGFISTPMMW